MKIPMVVVACVAAAITLPLHAATDMIKLPSAAEFSAQLLPETPGTVSWRTLAQVEPVPVNGKSVMKFSNAILGLDRKDVKIAGFIIPLDVGADQKHFLISAIPVDCQFCMPAGPDAVVEVVSRKPVQYGTEPVMVSGKFAVLKNDPRGILYQITDATSVTIEPAKR